MSLVGLRSARWRASANATRNLIRSLLKIDPPCSSPVSLFPSMLSDSCLSFPERTKRLNPRRRMDRIPSGRIAK